MGFLQAIWTCFRKYFTFSGRARRSEFWYWMLFTFGISFLFNSFLWEVWIFDPPASGLVGVTSLYILFILVTFIPSITVSWRRLHDTGRSGWLYGAGMIGFFMGIGIMYGLIFMDEGFVGSGIGAHHDNGTVTFSTIAFLLFTLVWSVVFIIFTCQDSDNGPNKHGPSPKYGGEGIFD